MAFQLWEAARSLGDDWRIKSASARAMNASTTSSRADASATTQLHRKVTVGAKFATVDDYIASFPADVQTILETVRSTIRRGAPGTEEAISYNMPTVRLNGHCLVFFAGWKHHVGLYPIPRVDEPLDGELSPYRAVKDTLRFPLRRPIPYELIERLVGVLAAKILESER